MPFTNPTIPNNTPRNPNRIGTKTTSRTPLIIPAMDQAHTMAAGWRDVLRAYEGRGSVNSVSLIVDAGPDLR